MEIVDALNKLSFSFWQIVVLVALWMFRSELKEIVLRIATVKVAGSEITWAQKSDTVLTLKNLKSEIQKGPRSDTEIVGLIESKIHNRVLFALSNLKRGTSYVWPALVDAEVGSNMAAPIRQETLDRVHADLEVLKGSGVLNYQIELDDRNPRGVHMFSVKSVSEELVRLIAEVQQS